MDERAVRAAVDRLTNESYGLWEPKSGAPCQLVPVEVIDALVEAVATEPERPDRLGPLAEAARLKARSVRDDHADGARCDQCTDDGCPRLSMWSPTILRMGDALDEPD